MSPEREKNSGTYALKTLLAGGIAGCAAKSAVAPLDRVKILLQTSHSSVEIFQGLGSIRGGSRALVDIYHSQGFRALFQGHSATLLRIFPYAGVKFMAYEQFKRLLMPTQEKESGPRNFIAGSLAGCTASVFAYPLDVIRVRLAFEVASGEKRLFQLCKIIYAEPHPLKPNGGLINFYRGLGPTLLGMIPYAGVSFYTYESLKTIAANTPYFCNKNPPPALAPWATLAIGAISGMAAQTCSYPLEIIRRHMQVASRGEFKDVHTTISQTTKDIMKRKGVRGFFVGIGLGYLKTVPMFAVSFYTYELCKTFMHIH